MPLASDADLNSVTTTSIEETNSSGPCHLVVNDEDILLASDGSKRRNSSFCDEVDSGYSKSSTPTDSAPGTTGSVRFGLKTI